MQFFTRKNRRHKNLIGGGLFLLGALCLVSTGFSTWTIYINDNVSNATSEKDIGVAGVVDKTTTEQDYIDIDARSKITSLDVDSDNSTSTDYLTATLSWENTNANSKYSDDLNDYFYLFDENNRIGENSPHVTYGVNNNRTIRFDNHETSVNSITSRVAYERNFDVIDQTHTTWSEEELAECEAQLARESYVIVPRSGYTSEILDLGTVTTNITNSSGDVTATYEHTYLRLFCTRAVTDTASTDYRFHWFYFSLGADGKVETTMSRADSSTSQNASYTGSVSSIENPTVTSSNCALRTVKSPSTSTITYKVVVGTTQVFSGSTTLQANGSTSGSLGYDLKYQTVDKSKTRADFDTTTCEGFITSYLTNDAKTSWTISMIGGNNISYTYEGDFPYIMPYISREFDGTNYRRFCFFFFYYDKGSGELKVSSNFSRYDTSTTCRTTTDEWPTLTINPFNGRYSNYSMMYNVVTGRSYLKFTAKLPSKSSNIVANATIYLEAGYAYEIDKNLDPSNFNGEALTRYMQDNYISNATSNGATAVEVITQDDHPDNFVIGENDNEFPYVYFLASRYRLTNGTYYLRLFTFTHAIGHNTLTIAASGDLTIGSKSSPSTQEEWPTFTIHSESATSSASSLSKTFHQDATIFRFTCTYLDNSGATKSKVSSVTSLSFTNHQRAIGDYYPTYDSSKPATTAAQYKAAYNRSTAYALYTSVDTTKSYTFEGKWESHTSTDYGTCFKSYYSYVHDGAVSRVRNSNFYSYELKANTSNNINNTFYQGHYYSTGAPTSARVYLQRGKGDSVSGFNTDGYLGDDYEISKIYLKTQMTKNQQQRVVQEFTNGTDTYSFYYPVGGSYSKGYLKNHLPNNIRNYDLDYHIRLIPRSESIKADMHNIIADFTFSFSYKFESKGRWER